MKRMLNHILIFFQIINTHEKDQKTRILKVYPPHASYLLK